MFLVLIGFLVIIMTINSSIRFMVTLGLMAILMGLWSEFHET